MLGSREGLTAISEKDGEESRTESPVGSRASFPNETSANEAKSDSEMEPLSAFSSTGPTEGPLTSAAFGKVSLAAQKGLRSALGPLYHSRATK